MARIQTLAPTQADSKIQELPTAVPADESSDEETCHVGTTSFHGEVGRGPFAPGGGRYWLFTSKLCPFAHRTEIVRVLKGLEQCVGLTVAGSVQTEQGWDLTIPYRASNVSPNPVNGVARIPDLYQLSSPDYSGRASVPVLFDKQTKTIVNNESAEIVLQLNSAFDDHRDCGHPGLDLYPHATRPAIDAINGLLADEFIGPIYRAGFARDQKSYEDAFDRVFAALDDLEGILADGRWYLTGGDLSLADVHAFPHLARFDPIYYSLYKLNLRHVSDYPHLSEYMERLWQEAAFRGTFDLQAVKEGYYLSCNQPNPLGVVPKGPAIGE